MKVLLIIGIIIIFVLLLFIYKKSKGEDLMDFSINEGFNLPDFNADATIPYEDLTIDSAEFHKLGDTPDPLSSTNPEEGKLVSPLKPDEIPELSDASYNQLMEQKNELLNQATTWVDETAAYRTQGQGNLYEDKLNDPGNNMAEPPKSEDGRGISDFIQLDNQGSKMDTSFLDAPEEQEHDKLAQDFEVTGEEDSPPDNVLHQKDFKDSSSAYHNDADIARKIKQCKSLSHCGQLPIHHGCGFCADDGYGKFFSLDLGINQVQ